MEDGDHHHRSNETQPRLFAFLFTMREWIANWEIPCSSKIVRYWMNKADNVLDNPLHQRRIILIVVCIALLLDNMLYMVIVPIIPTYLRQIHAFPEENITFYKNVTEIIRANSSYNMVLRPTTAMTITSMKPFSSTTAEFLRSSTLASPVVHEKKNEPNNTITRSILMYATVYSENEDVNVGVLFACKAIFQLLVNPFTGTLMDRIGYDVPMMIGLSIIFFSTMMFAFGTSYGALFFARSLQGVGSAFADTSGLAMIADRYTDDASRTAALGIALAFISFGSLVAPPFGGTLYEFAGKAVPFIILALLALFDGCLMLFSMRPARKERRELKKKDKLPRGTPIYKLIIDPYIAVCAGCLVMANVSLAFIEPTIALWMKDTMDAPEWQMGLIWLPAFIPHLLGVLLTVKLAERYPSKQWLMAAIGLAMEGTSCMIIPFCKSFAVLMVPLCILCFGIALVDTAILPLLGHLVDVRHVSVYGSVYAIADISYSLAYAFGPVLAGEIVKSIGFTALNAGIFVSNILYAPLLVFLRKAYDYQKFQPSDEEDADVNGDLHPNHKTYKTYTADSDDAENALEFAEQSPLDDPSVENNESSESSSDESSDESEEESRALNEEESAGGLAGNAKPNPLRFRQNPPTPQPRQLSIDKDDTSESSADSANSDSDY